MKQKTKLFNPEKKLDLVLLQGFPANETLSAGAVKYINEFFNTHFINLPGFHKNCPPLEEVTFENLCRYIEDEIDKKNLDRFLLAGISFGFALANSINVKEEKLLAVFGIAPFLGTEYLQMGNVQRVNRKALLEVSRKLGIQQNIWGKKGFKKLLGFMMAKSGQIIDIVMDECEPNAFFETASMILNLQPEAKFRDVPHILLINEKDTAINAPKTIEAFKKGISPEKLDIIYTKMPHYPKDTSYEYFKANFKDSDFEYIYTFLENCK